MARKHPSPRVAIIGGGLASVAACHSLRKAGIDDITVFEASAGPGGVWWDSRYPGAAVDTTSAMYSFSFAKYKWKGTHATRAEILEYVEDIIEREDLRRHYRFKTKVDEVEWDDTANRYRVKLDSGDAGEFDFVISAVGMLNVPAIPPTLAEHEFRGTLVHTARWDPKISLDGCRVGVVGTGSSAIQVFPRVAEVAERAYLFQRKPGWILPKADRVFDEVEAERASRGTRYYYNRLKAYASRHRNKGPAAFRPGTRQNAAAEAQARAHIARELSTRPDLMEKLTPDYPFGGTRPISAPPDFYRSFLRENVELVPEAVERITERGVLTAAGRQVDLDVIVLATGFRAADYLSTLRVRGAAGADLHEFWNGVPSAFLGMCVPGFPNFFMMYGPNTNGMGLIFMLERQAEFIARMVKASRRRTSTLVEVSQSDFDQYNSQLAASLEGTVWGGVDSYFRTADGHVVTQYPWGLPRYWVDTKRYRASRLLREADPSGTAVSDSLASMER